MNHEMMTFDIFNDDRGSLAVFESENNMPFTIKRVYCIYNVPEGKKRACHAHRNIEQVLVCLKGSCTCFLDDGRNKKEILLFSPQEGLYLRRKTWLEITDFSPDCVLMVLSDSFYDESDTIKDFESFLRLKETEW